MDELQEKTPRGPGLVVRLTPDEREAWHAAARAQGYAQTARWVRAIIAARLAAGASNRPASKNPVPVEVLAQLGKIGGNVNQLAHRANAAALNGEPFPATVAELEAVRRELSAVREALAAQREELTAQERDQIVQEARSALRAQQRQSFRDLVERVRVQGEAGQEQ